MLKRSNVVQEFREFPAWTSISAVVEKTLLWGETFCKVFERTLSTTWRTVQGFQQKNISHVQCRIQLDHRWFGIIGWPPELLLKEHLTGQECHLGAFRCVRWAGSICPYAGWAGLSSLCRKAVQNAHRHKMVMQWVSCTSVRCSGLSKSYLIIGLRKCGGSFTSIPKLSRKPTDLRAAVSFPEPAKISRQK